MNGIIIIDKPTDWTSQDVVSKLRGVFRQRRIGHGGTLDPMATGVLPVFVGRATRGVEFFESASKEYIAGLRLGVETDTQDITGNVLKSCPVSITREQLLETLQQFTGKLQQVPPMYSAVKIGGKKLYELARQGKEIERKARTIEIFELELLGGQDDCWQLRILCSKGTYVRTLCHDIGRALGCGACMDSLRRTRAGSYAIEEAMTIDQLLATDFETLPQLLRGVDTLFPHAQPITATEAQERVIRNGGTYSTRQPDGEYRIYNQDGEFLTLSKASCGKMETIKSFFEV